MSWMIRSTIASGESICARVNVSNMRSMSSSSGAISNFVGHLLTAPDGSTPHRLQTNQSSALSNCSRSCARRTRYGSLASAKPTSLLRPDESGVLDTFSIDRRRAVAHCEASSLSATSASTAPLDASTICASAGFPSPRSTGGTKTTRDSWNCFAVCFAISGTAPLTIVTEAHALKKLNFRAERESIISTASALSSIVSDSEEARGTCSSPS